MFVNIYILAGSGGAAVPLILHLLARARYRNVDWGAMMFLNGISPRQSQSARLKQWALLGLRMLLVALIAVALARPIAGARWAEVGTEARVRAVIILDRSASMGLEEAGKSRLEKAKEAALGVLSALRRGDEVALVLMGEQIEVKDPKANLQAAARDVSEVQITSGSADVAAALEEARNILQQEGRFGRELYLICDQQAVSWRNVGGRGLDTRWLRNPRAPVRFYVAPVGGAEAENVAIESVEAADAITVRRHPTELEVRLRNYGSHARTGVELSISSNPPTRRRPTTVPVNLPARGTTTVRVPMTFDRSGSHIVTATVRASDLDIDNRLDSVVEVMEPLQAMIVSGDESGSELHRKSAFLRLALAPYQTRRGEAGDEAVVTVRTAEDWGLAPLGKYQVIILANVQEVSADLARALEQKVYEGGGLIVCPGALTQIDEYNNTLYRDGQGLLPAKLSTPVAADGSEATTIGKLDGNHPVFRFRAGADWMPDAVVGRYFPATPRGDAKVLGFYDSGRPFLIEGRRGRGRVLLLTTSLDGDWSTLPLDGSMPEADARGRPGVPKHPFFLPFVQSMVQYVCAPLAPNRNLSPGESLGATFDTALASAELWRDDQPIGAAPIVAGGTQVRYTETRTPGIYRLQVRYKRGGTHSVYFVVQGSRGEPDLSGLSAQQWQGYQRLLGFSRIDPAREPIAARVAADRGGRELWLPLLVAAILMAMTELGLGRAWSREMA